MKQSILNNYSDEAFIEIVKNSYSYKECMQKLGYVSVTGKSLLKIKDRVKILNIDVSHFCRKEKIIRTFENVFCKNSTVSSKVLRSWYRRGNYTEYKCSICGQEPFWNGKSMTLILDHINGFNNDNRLENIRWVCPNCNIQLDTNSGKNKNHGIHKVYYCIDCGRKLSNGYRKRCVDCAKKSNSKIQCIISENNDFIIFPNANKVVYREELKQLIREKTFLFIGEYYGVSDNTIRNWCKRFGLPFKSSKIKEISEEDWKNI